MRVLFITRGLAPDDASPEGQACAAHLRDLRRHHQVDVVAGFVRSRRLIPSDALGVDLCGRRGVGASWALRRAVWRRARALKPDLVVSASPDAPRCGVPAIALTHRAPDPSQQGLPARARLSRLAGFTRVIAPDDTVKDDLINGGLDAERIEVMAPGVVPLTRRVQTDPTAPLRLLCAGPIGPAHGQHLAIDAVSRLAPVEKAAVQLDIVGYVQDPVYLGHLRVQAHRQPVRLQPGDEAPADQIAQAHMVLTVPLVEPPTQPALAQALVSGVPAVWSDLPALRRLTAGTGHAIPTNDVLALRDTIRALLVDRASLDAQATRELPTARARLTAAVAQARWQDLVRSTLDLGR